MSPSRSTAAQVAPAVGAVGSQAHRTSSYASAGPTSAPASPTKVDGKEFFKQARYVSGPVVSLLQLLHCCCMSGSLRRSLWNL